jgi:hypothetical protein
MAIYHQYLNDLEIQLLLDINGNFTVKMQKHSILDSDTVLSISLWYLDIPNLFYLFCGDIVLRTTSVQFLHQKTSICLSAAYRVF